MLDKSSKKTHEKYNGLNQARQPSWPKKSKGSDSMNLEEHRGTTKRLHKCKIN
jgi:hypothetical protein